MRIHFTVNVCPICEGSHIHYADLNEQDVGKTAHCIVICPNNFTPYQVSFPLTADMFKRAKQTPVNEEPKTYNTKTKIIDVYPTRDCPIGKEDILDLEIALNTTSTVEDFLKAV